MLRKNNIEEEIYSRIVWVARGEIEIWLQKNIAVANISLTRSPGFDFG